MFLCNTISFLAATLERLLFSRIDNLECWVTWHKRSNCPGVVRDLWSFQRRNERRSNQKLIKAVCQLTIWRQVLSTAVQSSNGKSTSIHWSSDGGEKHDIVDPDQVKYQDLPLHLSRPSLPPWLRNLSNQVNPGREVPRNLGLAKFDNVTCSVTQYDYDLRGLWTMKACSTFIFAVFVQCFLVLLVP